MPVYTQINEKLLEVKISAEKIFAKRGSMISYSGDILFKRSFLAGQGVQDLARRTVTNESSQTMEARGTGTLYYGHLGLFVTVVPVRNETLYIENNQVLAFDQRLTAGTMFLGNQGGISGAVRGAVSGQGLFTTTFQGTGEVAILSDGNAIGLPVRPDKPVIVDPNAYIGHVGQLTSSFVIDVNWKTFIGQTSGETYQVKFSGTGTVYIQASER